MISATQHRTAETFVSAAMTVVIAAFGIVVVVALLSGLMEVCSALSRLLP